MMIIDPPIATRFHLSSSTRFSNLRTLSLSTFSECYIYSVIANKLKQQRF